MDRLYIHLTDDEQLEYLRVEGEQRPVHRPQRATLQEIAGYAHGCQVIVLVPAERMVLTTVSIPTSNRQRQMQAVPYLLEDLLADDVERLHFALGGYRNEEVAVAAVAHEQMRAWLERLSGVGIQTRTMIPDLLALPYAEGEWSVVVSDSVAWIRNSEQGGFCCDTANLATLLEQALTAAGEQRPQRLQMVDCRQHDTQKELLPPELGHQATACEEGVLYLLASGYQSDADTPINLLQGRYSQRERLGKLWRPWRPAAALALALLVIQGVMAGMEYRRLSAEKQRLVDQVESSFRSGFPEIKRIVNPRLQAERALKELRGQGGGGGFLTILDSVGPVLAESGDTVLQGIGFKEGGLVLDLRLKDLQQLDGLEQKLKQTPQLQTEVLSASSRDGHVEARIRAVAGS